GTQHFELLPPGDLVGGRTHGPCSSHYFRAGSVESNRLLLRLCPVTPFPYVRNGAGAVGRYGPEERKGRRARAAFVRRHGGRQASDGEYPFECITDFDFGPGRFLPPFVCC